MREDRVLQIYDDWARMELSKFGEIKEFKDTDEQTTVKIGLGFSGNIKDTVQLMALCKEIAGEKYNTVKTLHTELNLFHIILKK